MEQFLLGLVIGGLLVFVFLPNSGGGEAGLISRQAGEKAKNKAKISGLIGSKGRITNDDVQNALGVSDATATRYLEELEKEGVLKQVGAAGKYTYYEKR